MGRLSVPRQPCARRVSGATGKVGHARNPVSCCFMLCYYSQMLVVHKVSVGQAGYYLDGRSPGIWTGTGCDALGVAGAVDRATFVAALSGCDRDGRLLLGRRTP